MKWFNRLLCTLAFWSLGFFGHNYWVNTEVDVGTYIDLQRRVFDPKTLPLLDEVFKDGKLTRKEYQQLLGTDERNSLETAKKAAIMKIVGDK